MFGSIRVPCFSPGIAEMMAMPIMFVVIVVAARRIVRRLAVFLRTSQVTWYGLRCACRPVWLPKIRLCCGFRAYRSSYPASRDPVSGKCLLRDPWGICHHATSRGLKMILLIPEAHFCHGTVLLGYTSRRPGTRWVAKSETI